MYSINIFLAFLAIEGTNIPNALVVNIIENINNIYFIIYASRNQLRQYKLLTKLLNLYLSYKPQKKDKKKAGINPPYLLIN